MSKRFYPQQQGDRKKAKLDISISDHNFPLSQNQEPQEDNWGDDNDDEILLLASQACEEAYTSNDISQLPDYSFCMQPACTSTQIQPQPSPSTSKSDFQFKKPSFNPPSAISTHLKEKCGRISSPLPGISSKVISKSKNTMDMSDDFIINDKIFQGQDLDYVYKQLLQLQEENAKLKSENGRLLDKCVTKEGEASILRTQLKSSQVAVDNARLEKIKAQERVQLEWNEKLVAVKNQMHELRTQLDFKNLEIISIKEKCKRLESNKVKLTQVTVGANDISLSHRNNNSTQNDSLQISRRAKVSTSSAQTDDKANTLKLNRTRRLEQSNLSTMLSLILEPSVDQYHSILDYNEKLQKTTDLSQNICRIYSTFHRLPSTPVHKDVGRCKMKISSLYDDIVGFAEGCDDAEKRYLNIHNSVLAMLNDTQSKLELLCQRVTTSFQKEMDERYMDITTTYLSVNREHLLRGRELYTEEHEILARRMVAVLGYILETSRGLQLYIEHESSAQDQIVTVISRICTLLNNTSCATLYSGLLYSIITILQAISNKTSQPTTKVLDILKTILTSRPMPFVVLNVLEIVKSVCLWDSFGASFCPGTSVGNLKTDYDQGVLLYKKDSCYIQVLLKQTEICLKCIEKQKLYDEATQTTQNLILLYSNVSENTARSLTRDKSRCDCQLMMVQLIVYALRICAVMLHSTKHCFTEQLPPHVQLQLLSICRCGIQVLYACSVREELSSQLSHNEGHLIEFCELMRNEEHPQAYGNMLTELAGTLQCSPEDMPPSFHKQPWLKSFENFSLVD